MPPRAAVAAALSSRVVRVAERSSEGYICPSCRFSTRAKPSRTRRWDAGRERQQQRQTQSVSQSATTTRRGYKSCSSMSVSTPPRYARAPPSQRYASTTGITFSSATAINPPLSISPALQPLYTSLSSLSHPSNPATNYLDHARLQLCLRSLESSDPVIRIAVLGVGAQGEKAARRLVRVLLADALGDGVEGWERELLGDGQEGSVLVRYGEEVEDVGVAGGGMRGGKVRELKVPSPLLRKANVEVLITGLNVTGGNAGGGAGVGAVGEGERLREWEHRLLVPALTIPAMGGRVGFVRYPVHRAIVVAEGVGGAVELGRLPQGLLGQTREMIRVVVSLPVRKQEGEEKMSGNEGVVDVGLAEHALALFRESRANGAQFSREWQESQVGIVAKWLTQSGQSQEPEQELKPAVKDLVDSLLERTQSAVETADKTALATYEAQSIPETKRTALREAVATWSKDAHHDLQTNLSTAFLGPAWRRTTWWRLFWRIDEVSISASDVLRRGWLVEAEQNLAFLSGQLLEAGVATENQLRGISQQIEPPDGATPSAATAAPTDGQALLDPRTEKEMSDYSAVHRDGILKDGRPETVAELMQLPPLLSKIREDSGLNALFNPPWPQTLNLAREQIIHESVPNLHAKAQKFMLAALSTIGGSSALAVWLWVASGGVAAYESGAVAALGLVWALRRLQKKYGGVREGFKGMVREDARRVLGDVEGRLVRLVTNGGRADARLTVDRREREEVRRVLADVRKVVEGR